MTSIHYYLIAGAFAVCATVFTTLGWVANKREQGKSSATLSAKVESLKSEITARLDQRNRSIQDQLREKYPYGYILFGGQGGDMVTMPFYDGGLFVDAKWEQTKIELDRNQKIARVTILQPSWKQDTGATLRINVTQAATVVIHYDIGQPTPINLVKSAGQPQMLFEVLDDNQRTPTTVIGFRKE